MGYVVKNTANAGPRPPAPPPRYFVNKDEDPVDSVLKKAKGEILKEFEKVCPTDTSFQRIKKDMHDVFEELRKNLN